MSNCAPQDIAVASFFGDWRLFNIFIKSKKIDGRIALPVKSVPVL
jgi:hypothetical protein